MFVYFLKHKKDGALGKAHFLDALSLDDAKKELCDLLKVTQKYSKKPKILDDYVIISDKEYQNNQQLELEQKKKQLELNPLSCRVAIEILDIDIDKLSIEEIDELGLKTNQEMDKPYYSFANDIYNRYGGFFNLDELTNWFEEWGSATPTVYSVVTFKELSVTKIVTLEISEKETKQIKSAIKKKRI